MRDQCILGVQQTPFPDLVNEGSTRALDTPLPGHRGPVPSACHLFRTRIINDFCEVYHSALQTATRNLTTLFREPTISIHHSDGNKSVTGELEHKVFNEPASYSSVNSLPDDLPGSQEAQGIDNVDKVIEYHPTRTVRMPLTILLHQDKGTRQILQPRVSGSISPIESDHQA